jgi:hypothetical protein
MDTGPAATLDSSRGGAIEPAEGLLHLQGCYIDIDGPRSLWRVLRRRLGGDRQVRRSA